MTLHQLKIFDVVAKHLNTTKAAKEIGISQPSISKQLRLLEQECGTKFHVKFGRGIKLTEMGRSFRNDIRPILRQIDHLKESFGEKERKSATLTIASTHSTSASFLPEALRVFRQSHPNVQHILLTADSRNIEQMLLNGEVDIALTTLTSSHPNIVAEPFRSEKITAVVSAKHPLAKKDKLTQEVISQIPIIIWRGGRVAKLLEETGVKLNIVMECDSHDAVKAAVQSGLGVGFFYRDNVALGLKEGYLKTLIIPLLKQRDVKRFIIYRRGAHLSRNTTDFLAFLRRWPVKPTGLAARQRPVAELNRP